MGLFFHGPGQLSYRAISDHLSLTMLNAGRHLATLADPGCTQITIGSGERNIINPQPTIRQGCQDLVKMNPAFADRVSVLLLAGYLAGMAAGTIFIIKQ
jgi:hypothetical protein